MRYFASHCRKILIGFFSAWEKKTNETQKYGILLMQNAVGKSKKGFPDEKAVERGKEKSISFYNFNIL